MVCRLRLTRKEIAGLAAGVLFLCLVQAHGAYVRFRVNTVNVLIARILPDPEAREFFLRHGMPLAYAELEKSLPLLPLEAVDANVVNRGRTALELLGTQYVRSAPRTYALWLLTHPVRTLRTIYQERAFVFSDDFLWLDSSRLRLASVARRLETGNELETRPATPYFVVRHRLLELRPSGMERAFLWRFDCASLCSSRHGGCG